MGGLEGERAQELVSKELSLGRRRGGSVAAQTGEGPSQGRDEEGSDDEEPEDGSISLILETTILASI